MAASIPSTGPVALPPQYPFLARPDAGRFDLLAEQLHRLLAGGDPSRDSPYHRAELRLVCEEAWEFLEAERIRKNKDIQLAWDELQLKRNKELYTDALKERFDLLSSNEYYVRPFVLKVLYDEQREVNYCLLPDDYVKLTRYERLPGEGIQEVAHVRRSQQRQQLFVPYEGAQVGVFQGLLNGGLQGNIGYYQEGPQLVFETEPGCGRMSVPEVLAKMIIRNDMLSQLSGPALFEPTTNLAVLSQAQQTMRLRTPSEDNSNDGTDTR